VDLRKFFRIRGEIAFNAHISRVSVACDQMRAFFSRLWPGSRCGVCLDAQFDRSGLMSFSGVFDERRLRHMHLLFF
jgi:hypothetical protein